MAGEEDTDVRWVERDPREWVEFARQPDQLTARMTCTYLEAGGIEARVGTHEGHFCVEVPFTQVERAYTVYQPADSNIAPPMDEQSRKTGIHTGQLLRSNLLKPAKQAPEGRSHRRILKWLLRVLVIGTLVALLLLIFQS